MYNTMLYNFFLLSKKKRHVGQKEKRQIEYGKKEEKVALHKVTLNGVKRKSG